MAKFDVNAAVSSVKINTTGSGRAYIKEMIDTSSRVVKRIPLDLIDDFPGHPFSVKDDTDMELLVDSVKQNGIITPIEVRVKDGGRYELISGHRRRRASTLAGLSDIPAIIEELTDEEATVRMVDANLQREKILPSEKAFAYKMKLEALKRQGSRSDLTSSQVEKKLGADEKIAAASGESRAQIQRYIRLTNLIPYFLNMLDNGKLPFTVAVELSYIPEDKQLMLSELIKKAPQLPQASELKHLSNAGFLTFETAERVLFPKKFEIDEDEETVEEVLPETSKKNDVLTQLKEKFGVSDIPNWNGDDNQVMKGYILKAVAMWNRANLTEQITQKTLDNLLTALSWATDELTAEEAYHYYEKKR